MDYFAVGGRPLLSGRIYASIFGKNRFCDVEPSQGAESVAFVDAVLGPPGRHGSSEAATSSMVGPSPEESTLDPDEQVSASRKSITAPTALHKGFSPEEVSPWDPCRFEEIRKLQDASRNRGQVHLMRDMTSNRLVAVKKMPTAWVRKCHADFVVEHPSETELPWQDVGCIRFLNSVGFVYGCELLGVHRDESYTYVVASFATEGDLFSWCETGAAPSLEREAVVQPLARMIFKAIQQLHDFSIVHRDLSLENILLSKTEEDGGEFLEIRIIDFSMASTARRFRRCVRGKASYQAPELHTEQEYDAYLSDAFALGVTLYAVLLKDYPWLSTRPGGCKCFEYVRKHGFLAYLTKRKLRNSNARVGDLMSEPLKMLLSGLLALDPDERLTLGERDWNGSRRSVWDEPWLAHGPGRG